MKYEKEIDILLREILYEDWLTEDEYNEIISDAFKKMAITKEKLSNDIEIGVQNGYSIEYQFSLIKQVLL